MTNTKLKEIILDQYVKQILRDGIKSEREFKLIQNYRQLTVTPTQKIVDSFVSLKDTGSFYEKLPNLKTAKNKGGGTVVVGIF